MHRRTGIVVVLVLLVACGSVRSDVSVVPGGTGDALFPDLGNRGYDVTHYDLALTPDLDSGTLQAVATIDARAPAPLPEFSLDLDGLTVDAVTIDGTAATWSRRAGKLAVTPAKPLGAGASFQTAVRYHGVPVPKVPPDGIRLGWIRTAHGAYVVDEPDGAHTWFPSNDVPSDKATFTFHVTVPDGITAVANGTLASSPSSGGATTWTWTSPDPMATYLAVVAVGDYELQDGSAYRRSDAAEVQPCLDRPEQVVRFFEPYFGPYPFDTVGLLVTDSPGGLAVETQTRPLFSSADFAAGCPDVVIAHELAHQWFGDAVTPAQWQDVWLNEGFATYAEWLWGTHDDAAMLDRLAARARDDVARSGGPASISHPTVRTLFAWPVYGGGATVLHALRREVGDDTFFATLRAWVARYRGASATTDDFIAVASATAGRDLGPFLRAWLDGTTMPELPVR